MVDFLDTYPPESGPPPPGGAVPNVRGTVFIVILLLSFVTATAFGGVRIYTKAFITRALGWDDYACVVSMILNIPWTICTIIMVHKGMGLHLWDLHETFRSLEVYSHNAFIANSIYFATIMFIKLSILFLYLRIFTESRIFRRTVQILVFVIISSHVSIIFSQIFVYTHIECHWKIWEDDAEAERLCQTTYDLDILCILITWISVLTVILDLIIMALPCPAVWRLHLPQRQKLAILITLISGVIVTLASILRLVYLVRRFYYNAADDRFTEWQVNLISTIEINLALVCISLPVLKAFTRRFFPRLLLVRSSENQTQNGANGVPSKRVKSLQLSGHHHHLSNKIGRKRNGDSHEEDLVRHAGHPGYLELGEDGKSDQHIPMNAIEVKTAIDVESRAGV